MAVREGVTISRNDIRDQPILTGAIALGNDDPLSDLGVLRQGKLDLSQLDPMATDLHLVVQAPQVLETTIELDNGHSHRFGKAAHSYPAGRGWR